MSRKLLINTLCEFGPILAFIVLFEIKDDEDGIMVFEKNKYEIHHQEIQDVADISRDLLPLHSDWECIELNEEQQKAQEIAYSYWKYNDFYGFEPTK